MFTGGASPTAWYSQNPSLTIFGDSIAAGHLGYTAPHEGGPDGDETYQITYQLQQLYGSPFTFTNWGIGSSTLSGAAFNASSVVADGAAAYLLHSGINDIAGGTTVASMKSSLDTIYAAIPGDAHLFINEILPWTNGSDADAATIRNWNNTELPAWASGKNVTIVQVHDGMGQIRSSTGELDDLKTAYNADGVHPNVTGYTQMAALIKPFLDSYF